MTIHHSSITHSTTRNSATAVPSLKRLSHSKSIVSLRGAHIDLKIDKTATGSVADIRIQKSKHTRNGTEKPKRGSKKNKSNATIIADIRSQKIANIPMVFQLRRS